MIIARWVFFNSMLPSSTETTMALCIRGKPMQVILNSPLMLVTSMAISILMWSRQEIYILLGVSKYHYILTEAEFSGSRAIGFNPILSLFMAVLINGAMSYPTLPVSLTVINEDDCCWLSANGLVLILMFGICTELDTVAFFPNLHLQYAQSQAWKWLWNLRYWGQVIFLTNIKYVHCKI